MQKEGDIVLLLVGFKRVRTRYYLVTNIYLNNDFVFLFLENRKLLSLYDYQNIPYRFVTQNLTNVVILLMLVDTEIPFAIAHRKYALHVLIAKCFVQKYRISLRILRK